MNHLKRTRMIYLYLINSNHAWATPRIIASSHIKEPNSSDINTTCVILNTMYTLGLVTRRNTSHTKSKRYEYQALPTLKFCVPVCPVGDGYEAK